MMDCELPGNPSPEKYTSIGPLQKVRLLIIELTIGNGDKTFGVWTKIFILT
jgi:hypothetical protein